MNLRCALVFPLLLLSFAAAAGEPDAPPAPPTPPPTPTVTPAAPAADPESDDPVARLPPDVRARLTGAEVVEISRRHANPEGIVIPSAFFATIVGIVLLFIILRLRRDARLHETLRAMIDKGVDIPPALLVAPAAKKNDRRTGIILATAGVGVGGFLFVVDRTGSGAWALGLVPFFLGVGYLVANMLDRRKNDQEF